MTHKVASTTEREKEGGAFAYLGFTRASNTTNEVCRKGRKKKGGRLVSSRSVVRHARRGVADKIVRATAIIATLKVFQPEPWK